MTAMRNIWIWLDGTTLIKAVYNPVDRTLSIFDETERLLLRRTGLNPEQAHHLATRLAIIGAKRTNDHDESFAYL